MILDNRLIDFFAGRDSFEVHQSLVRAHHMLTGIAVGGLVSDIPEAISAIEDALDDADEVIGRQSSPEALGLSLQIKPLRAMVKALRPTMTFDEFREIASIAETFVEASINKLDADRISARRVFDKWLDTCFDHAKGRRRTEGVIRKLHWLRKDLDDAIAACESCGAGPSAAEFDKFAGTIRAFLWSARAIGEQD